MADESINGAVPVAGQLVQVRAPLDQAAEIFGGDDAQGRAPIVVIPRYPSRFRNDLIGIGALILLLGILGNMFFNRLDILVLAVVASLIVIALGVRKAFFVSVPEGVTALLLKGGKHAGTLDGGIHRVPPWITVSHLVARREIPYDPPIFETPTRDNVRASVDSLVIFSITDPYRFVYNITASDFDQVLQATCQDALRTMVRQVSLDRVLDIAADETESLRVALSEKVEPYGVTIIRATITAAHPPLDFLRSEESRHLAIVQRAEQAERQALAKLRQADEEALARQQVLARLEREREELQIQIQQAEARRRVVELETESETLRLATLEVALQKYPLAAEHERQKAELDVARALAGNTRAVLQVGSANEIARAFVSRDILQQSRSSELDGRPSEGSTTATPG